MIISIKSGDRLHMTVWKSPRILPDSPWCAALALNGIPLSGAKAFPTWREAYDYASSAEEPAVDDLPDTPGDRRAAWGEGAL